MLGGKKPFRTGVARHWSSMDPSVCNNGFYFRVADKITLTYCGVISVEEILSGTTRGQINSDRV